MNLVLIHGQSRTSLMMRPLGLRLQRQGFRVHYFNYFCLLQSVESIVDKFVQFLHQQVAKQPYIVITHSLGGLIARLAFQQIGDNNHLPNHLVMIVPPNHPPRIAKWAYMMWPYRLFTRDCGKKLADDQFFETLSYPPMPTTIIAGTRNLYRGILPQYAKPNDGILAVAETTLDGQTLPILVHAGHTTIINSPIITKQVLQIIANLNP